MIARTWTCTCPPKHKNGFLDHLRKTGIHDASAVPGYMGAKVMQKSTSQKVEITLVTFWQSMKHIQDFAGSDVTRAKLYPGDEQFEIAPDNTVKHYSVAVAPLSD